MKYCSQCGSGMQDNDKFCMNCGSAYTEARGSIESPSPPAIPAKEKPGLSLMTKMIIGFLLAIVLATGGLWGWNTYGTEARVEKKLDLAVKYISDNNYEQAILAFNDAINIDPREVQGYRGLAKAYTLQGNYDEARNTYEKGIAAVNQQNKQILQLGLAGMYIDQNKLTDAEQAYSDIINTSPDCLEAYWGLAMVYQQQGDSSKVESILRQAVANNPNEYRGYNTLALFLSQNNKQDEALKNIVQSLAIEINQQEAYLVLDSMYQNKWDELRNKTTSLSNQNVAAMIEFYSYYAAGDYPNAINTYQSKLSSQTTNQKAKILAAVCLVKNGDKNSAEALIKQLNISKLNPWLLGDLGRYYLATGDQDKAKEYALKALQANPTNLDAIALLQSINANDPDAKIYTARALLYDWRPIQKSNQMLINWAETIGHNNPNLIILDSEEVNQNEAENTACNIVNYGLVCHQGDWIYYSNSNDDDRLYKIQTDGTERTNLNDVSSAYISVTGGWIYYANFDAYGTIYKIRPDGSGNTKVSDDESEYINVIGGWIYYSNWGDDWKLYKIRIDGSERTRLNDDNSINVNVVGEWIYYCNRSDDWKIYKIRTDGSGRTKVSDDASEYINVVGGWIYYRNGSDGLKLYKMRTDSSERTRLNDDISEDINVASGWIYYRNGSDSRKLYKIRIDGSERTRLNDDTSMNVNVAGGWIYYCNYSDGEKLYKMRPDGTERQVFY